MASSTTSNKAAQQGAPSNIKNKTTPRPASPAQVNSTIPKIADKTAPFIKPIAVLNISNTTPASTKSARIPTHSLLRSKSTATSAPKTNAWINVPRLQNVKSAEAILAPPENQKPVQAEKKFSETLPSLEGAKAYKKGDSDSDDLDMLEVLWKKKMDMKTTTSAGPKHTQVEDDVRVLAALLDPDTKMSVVQKQPPQKDDEVHVTPVSDQISTTAAGLEKHEVQETGAADSVAEPEQPVVSKPTETAKQAKKKARNAKAKAAKAARQDAGPGEVQEEINAAPTTDVLAESSNDDQVTSDQSTEDNTASEHPPLDATTPTTQPTPTPPPQKKKHRGASSQRKLARLARAARIQAAQHAFPDTFQHLLASAKLTGIALADALPLPSNTADLSILASTRAMYEDCEASAKQHLEETITGIVDRDMSLSMLEEDVTAETYVGGARLSKDDRDEASVASVEYKAYIQIWKTLVRAVRADVRVGELMEEKKGDYSPPTGAFEFEVAHSTTPVDGSQEQELRLSPDFGQGDSLPTELADVVTEDDGENIFQRLQRNASPTVDDDVVMLDADDASEQNEPAPSEEAASEEPFSLGFIMKGSDFVEPPAYMERFNQNLAAATNKDKTSAPSPAVSEVNEPTKEEPFSLGSIMKVSDFVEPAPYMERFNQNLAAAENKTSVQSPVVADAGETSEQNEQASTDDDTAKEPVSLGFIMKGSEFVEAPAYMQRFVENQRAAEVAISAQQSADIAEVVNLTADDTEDDTCEAVGALSEEAAPELVPTPTIAPPPTTALIKYTPPGHTIRQSAPSAEQMIYQALFAFRNKPAALQFNTLIAQQQVQGLKLSFTALIKYTGPQRVLQGTTMVTSRGEYTHALWLKSSNSRLWSPTSKQIVPRVAATSAVNQKMIERDPNISGNTPESGSRSNSGNASPTAVEVVPVTDNLVVKADWNREAASTTVAPGSPPRASPPLAAQTNTSRLQRFDTEIGIFNFRDFLKSLKDTTLNKSSKLQVATAFTTLSSRERMELDIGSAHTYDVAEILVNKRLQHKIKLSSIKLVDFLRAMEFGEDGSASHTAVWKGFQLCAETDAAADAEEEDARLARIRSELGLMV